MACRGVFFAVTDEQVQKLLAASDDQQLMQVIEEIEEAWDTDNLAECDKAWDAMHRTLTGGKLEGGNGAYPLSHAVIGPRQLHKGDDYIVSLVTPEQVRDAAAALGSLSEEWFRQQYRSVVPKSYSPNHGQEDLDYTWDWFQGVRDLYAKAAERGRAIIFTVDQ